MSYEDSIRSLSFESDASIAIKTGVPGQSQTPNKGKQYTFVKLVSRRTVGLATGVNDLIVGVLQNKPQVVGAASTVAIRGVSMVEAGAAITAGDLIQANATGQAVTRTGSNPILGVAVEAAAASGHLVPVLLRVN